MRASPPFPVHRRPPPSPPVAPRMDPRASNPPRRTVPQPHDQSGIAGPLAVLPMKWPSGCALCAPVQPTSGAPWSDSRRCSCGDSVAPSVGHTLVHASFTCFQHYGPSCKMRFQCRVPSLISHQLGSPSPVPNVSLAKSDLKLLRLSLRPQHYSTLKRSVLEATLSQIFFGTIATDPLWGPHTWHVSL